MARVEDEIAEVAQALKQPAGPSAAYGSAEAVRQNHDAFVTACHATWKHWHGISIERLLFHEGFLKAEKARPIHPAMASIGHHHQAVWRRVNDAIVWTLFGMERHRVKRLCLYRKRGNLTECNPDSVLRTLADYNADPMSVALWNDATSCVDMGDITLVKDGRCPHPEFVELKEGTVNTEIIDILKTEGEVRDAALTAFTERRGPKGRKQFDRVIRQKALGDQALHLLQHEQGIDPVTGLEMRVVESPVTPESYDGRLRDMMARASGSPDGVLDCIDGCLWIYVGYGGIRAAPKSVDRFVRSLETKSTWWASANTRSPPADWDRVISLSNCVRPPMSVPIFLRGFTPQQIAGVTVGAHQDNVLMYLDWDGFARLVEAAGGRFRWGNPKETGRARAMHTKLRPPLIRGRLPVIEHDGMRAYVSDPNLIELFYDGMTPWTIVQRMLERPDLAGARAQPDRPQS